MAFFIILVGLIFVTPFLAFDHDVNYLYDAFGQTCHQKLSRSLCVMSDSDSFWIADCTPQNGEYVKGLSDRKPITVSGDGYIGYKIPVCARDIGLYVAMLLGGAIYPIVRDMKDKRMYPVIYLLLAMVPIALDGGIQFISDAGFVAFAYESTNLIRLITGGIAGVVASIYAIPVLMNMFCRD
ncbi:MAG: DUF2085 domain-containing protein [Candidatus Micrarchaeota archaeon]|nr:DUF2085 domain-containing protein [Candidatus Micrarchaeota archaeon]